MRRTRVKHRSAKREREMIVRRRIVAEMTGPGKPCEACKPILLWKYSKGLIAGYVRRHRRDAVDVHEVLNRSQGGGITDRRNLVAVCRPCHRWVTEHPEESHALGFHLKRWETGDGHYEKARRKRDLWNKGIPTWAT